MEPWNSPNQLHIVELTAIVYSLLIAVIFFPALTYLLYIQIKNSCEDVTTF